MGSRRLSGRVFAVAPMLAASCGNYVAGAAPADLVELDLVGESSSGSRSTGE